MPKSPARRVFRRQVLKAQFSLLAAVALLDGAAISASGAAAPAGRFSGPPAAYSTLLQGGEAGPGQVIRTLSVEERAGVARKSALVRVPLFFGAGECRRVADLVLVPAGDAVGGNQELTWQADDIRPGPDGGIARVHLWFEVDLAAGEKRAYRLLRRDGANSAPGCPAMAVTERDGVIRIDTSAGRYVIGSEGGLQAVPAGGGSWEFGGSGLLSEVAVEYAAHDTAPARTVEFDARTAGRVVEWAAGPLFTTVRITLPGPAGSSLEQQYRVPRTGTEIVLSTALFTGEGGVVKRNQLLAGTVRSVAPAPARVPAGLRYTLRAEHAYTVSGVVNRDSKAVLLAVPLVLGGTNGQWAVAADGTVTLEGQGGLQRGNEGEAGTLRGYWSEIRLVPTTASTPLALWQVYRAHVQPLVAVVDEPGVSVDTLHAALADLLREMKPIGWRQEAGRALALGESGRVSRLLAAVSPAKEGDAAALVRGAQYDTAKLTQEGKRKLREDEKGRAYGRLDPYHITYTQSAAAAVATLTDAPPAITAVNYAMAKGVRDFGGKVDRTGYPYIDCFSRTFNMQLGPVLFGLTAGARQGDDALVRFYRDLATAPPALAVFGRGQRPYTGAPAGSADQTDYLYQAICDFWLRATEVLAGEDLSLHPLAYGRYTDCIDVMADRYHGVGAKDQAGAAGEVRANFFRGQAHTHRWLGWSCAPFIRLLQDPREHSAIGLTEAVRYARSLKGRWKNWPDLTYFELADLLVREGLARAKPPTRLPAAGPATVTRNGSQAAVSWSAVPGAAEYRVYRSEAPGGPYAWLNSPYLEPAPARLTATSFSDADPKPASEYVIIAVDAAGRAGDWPEGP